MFLITKEFYLKKKIHLRGRQYLQEYSNGKINLPESKNQSGKQNNIDVGRRGILLKWVIDYKLAILYQIDLQIGSLNLG